MVHALHLTRRLLQPNGSLITVHDLPTPHVIEVHSLGKFSKVGWLLDRDDFENSRSALNSIARVVSDGDFDLEDERDFDYKIYVNDLIELQEWLSGWWSSAILTDGIISRIEGLTRNAGQTARIVLALRARMTKLSAAQAAKATQRT